MFIQQPSRCHHHVACSCYRTKIGRVRSLLERSISMLNRSADVISQNRVTSGDLGRVMEAIENTLEEMERELDREVDPDASETTSTVVVQASMLREMLQDIDAVLVSAGAKLAHAARVADGASHGTEQAMVVARGYYDRHQDAIPRIGGRSDPCGCGACQAARTSLGFGEKSS